MWPSQGGLGPCVTPLPPAMPSARWGGAHHWAHSPCRCPVHTLPPSREDPGPTDDRGIVWPPQKPPLASRRRGNWHCWPREQEMSGRSPCGAGSCSVSSVLSGNRLPNYGAVPAALSSCRLCCCPLPSVLRASLGLGHLLPLPEGRRWLPRERPTLILPNSGVQLQAPHPTPQPGPAHTGVAARSSSPKDDCPGRALGRAVCSKYPFREHTGWQGSPAAPSHGSLRARGTGHPSLLLQPLYQPPNERINNSVGGQRSETQCHWGL